jgi:putative transcriptional regulator
MKLIDARKNERYTQQEVADYLGVSRPTYARIEANPELATVEDAKMLAEFLKFSVNEVFFESDCN